MINKDVAEEEKEEPRTIEDKKVKRLNFFI